MHDSTQYDRRRNSICSKEIEPLRHLRFGISLLLTNQKDRDHTDMTGADVRAQPPFEEHPLPVTYHLLRPLVAVVSFVFFPITLLFPDRLPIF